VQFLEVDSGVYIVRKNESTVFNFIDNRPLSMGTRCVHQDAIMLHCAGDTSTIIEGFKGKNRQLRFGKN
jgi:hypothetical protein